LQILVLLMKIQDAQLFSQLEIFKIK
jgi:hypothetical protein